MISDLFRGEMAPEHLIWVTWAMSISVGARNMDTHNPVVYWTPEGGRGKSDLFGVSVAIRPKAAHFNSTWFLQVGAPKGSRHGGGGTVYRCDVRGACRHFDPGDSLEMSGGRRNLAYKGKEDEAWMGGSMDIKEIDGVERSVVCGHRWINENLRNDEKIDVTYLMTGICYLQDLYGDDADESDVLKLLPLVDSNNIYTPKPYIPNLSTYHWGLGQAGLSVFLTAQSRALIIGAPGITHWVGGIVRYDSDLSFAVANFARSEVPKNKRYTYVGYSVAAGKFYGDNKTWYVAGAPRSANYRGEVFTFQFKGATDSVRVETVLRGSSFGEYFGASLVAEDVNGDGYDDLVVGAPLFSKRHPDEGRIYVYLGSNKGNLLLESQVMSGRSGRGRFGMCIGSLKDLDQDGYNDVVVGAPYEDEQRGAVYVYRGFSSGLRPRPDQRVLARDLQPYLRGFGISFSAAVDVDGNKLRDIAVGSHLSGNVVLLRSRPIVALHPEIQCELVLDRRVTSFEVTFCSSYSGTNAPSYADILQTIETDPLFGRARIADGPHNWESLRLYANQSICVTHTIIVNVTDKNYLPLSIILRNELAECSEDAFSRLCPIGDEADVTREISFDELCGKNSPCISDLRLSCAVPEFINGVYILGSTPHFRLLLGMHNSGEPAFEVKVKVWSNINLIEGGEATKSSRRLFWRRINEPISDSSQISLSLRIAADATAEPKKTGFFPKVAAAQLVLGAELESANADRHLADNKCWVAVSLISDASVVLHSFSSLPRVHMPAGDSDLNVTHYYEVEKKGRSPLPQAELFLLVPTRVVAYKVETSEWMHVVHSFSHIVEKPPLEVCEGPVKTVQSEIVPKHKLMRNINCSCTSATCHVLKIIFAHGISSGPSSLAKITMTVHVVGAASKVEEGISFGTSAVLRYFPMFEDSAEEVWRSETLALVAADRSSSVEGYAIALSVLFGGFILFLIASWLKKNEFFRRTKKEELQAMKDAETCFVYFSTTAQRL